MSKRKKSKGSKLPYLFSEGIKGLYRNKVLSVASTLVLSACSVVVGLFIILSGVIENNLSAADELYVITAYISAESGEESIDSAKNHISSLDNVKSVSYVSKQEALEELKSDGEEMSSVIDKYESHLSGYIRARFEIRFESYDLLNALVSSVENVDVVETVNTKLDLYHGISKLKSGVTAVSSALIIMLFLVAVFVTLNTVRLGIYYRRDEILLMRYMGATKLFITSPYIIECFLMGMISVLVALAANFALLEFILRPQLSDYGISGIASFVSYLPQILPAFVAVGILASSLSGAICVKKYLNV